MAVEKFLTIKEVAKRLRVSKHSVMRYIKAKKLLLDKRFLASGNARMTFPVVDEM